MGIIANIFGYVLKFCFGLVGNYGWAVVLFSIIIKVIIFPLTLKQQKAMKKNQELQPKLMALQEKYKDNQEQMALEYQKFMKENKFNPFGGCLLMIVQLFVLIGIFYVVANPIKYMEKYAPDEIDVALTEAIIAQDFSGDSGEFAKYCEAKIMEVSGDENIKQYLKEGKTSEEIYVMQYKNTSRYYELKILKQKYNNDELNFLGIDLSLVTAEHMSDFKLWIFPVLTTIAYYISLWMTSRKQKQNSKALQDQDGNEIPMPNMMMMNITMPLLSGWISFNVPQSMGLYWFMNSLLQIIIQFVTDKIVDKNKDEIIKK